MSTYECREITNGPTTNQTINISAFISGGYNWTLYPIEADCDANEDCKSHGETKHCTCCKKTENGTIGGFSVTTAIPVGDLCSQFDNSQPGLYGCVDSTTWSLSKCKNQDQPIEVELAEEIKRYKQLL